jgi:hypothetical protein
MKSDTLLNVTNDIGHGSILWHDPSSVVGRIFQRGGRS